MVTYLPYLIPDGRSPLLLSHMFHNITKHFPSRDLTLRPEVAGCALTPRSLAIL